MGLTDAAGPAESGKLDPGREPRNLTVDFARAAAIFIVVFFHTLVLQVRLVDGRPTLLPWSPGPIWWAASWLFLCIPMFFIAGGYSHAVIVDAMHRRGTGYGHFLASRGHRLIGPLTFFVTVSALVSTGFAWTGHLSAAVDISRQVMQLLWFISVYLLIVFAAPALVWLHDRYGVLVMLALGFLAAVVDQWSFAVHDYQLRDLNLLLVWPLAHQLGVAYHRGWFRRGPVWVPAVAAAVGVLAIVGLVFLGGYPASAVGFGDLPIANVQPPTVAMVALAAIQASGLAFAERFAPPISEKLARPISIANALMMTTYLWHIPCIALGAGTLVLLATIAPGLTWFWLHPLVVSSLSILIATQVVPLIGRVEMSLIPPLGPRQNLPAAATAFFILIAGTATVWRTGTVIHPASPWSTVGVLATWAGAGLLAWAANRPPAGAASAAS